MIKFIKSLFVSKEEPVKKEFIPTGKCPVCNSAGRLRFTSGRHMPYESCDQHQIQALMLIAHNRGYKVIAAR